MKKRWFIRSIFIGLLTLCVVAWGVSYWRMIGISYGGTARGQCLFAGNGEARFLVTLPDGPGGWQFYHNANRYTGYAYAQYHLVGFAFDRAGGQAVGGLPGWPIWAVWVPLYFPTLLFALLLWFVWRKTRAKRVGGAFPVEVTAAKTEGGKT